MERLKQFWFEIKLQLKEIRGELNATQKIALFFSAFFLCTLIVVSIFFSPKSEIPLAGIMNEQNLSGIGGVYIPPDENITTSTKENNGKNLEFGDASAIDAETEQLKQSLLQEESATEQEDVKEDSSVLQKYSYVVKEGDTLSQIAADYNVSVESIAGSSDIRMIDSLHVGQKLQIPSRDGFFYVVLQGDRLVKILDKYNVSFPEFLSANPGISADLVEEGDEVFLPGAKPQNIIRSWLVPVPSRLVTSGYGWRSYPRRAFHKGLDFRAAYVGVRAARNGVVTYAGNLGGYGNVIIIKHSGGYRSLYAHLSRIYVRHGTRVMQGTVIGKSGNTGYSFGPHLHFEVSLNGKTINPQKVLTGLRFK